LQEDDGAERSFRKFKLIAEDVKGRNVLTNFHGMDLTTDKLRSMVKKWQTLIEANVDVKTTDGYLLRVFCIGFTSKDQSSTRKTCYAQHTQVKTIIFNYSYFSNNYRMVILKIKMQIGYICLNTLYILWFSYLYYWMYIYYFRLEL